MPQYYLKRFPLIYMHAKTILHALCMIARHRACNLSSPACLHRLHELAQKSMWQLDNGNAGGHSKIICCHGRKEWVY